MKKNEGTGLGLLEFGVMIGEELAESRWITLQEARDLGERGHSLSERLACDLEADCRQHAL
jgi:hypothetical protein